MITAIVITRNEAANIERCLKSLGFCDQIVVVDSGSTDETVRLARAFTKDVHEMAWEGFVPNRNRALGHARNPWVLSVDADEVVPEALARAIVDAVRNPRETAAFSIKRKTYHLGRWIRFGGWYPNRLVRLFRKDRGRWEGAEVHEYWKAEGPVSRIEEDLLHYSFRDLADQVDRNNRYTTLASVALETKGAKFRWWKLIFKPMTKFMETYLLKLGCLDGYPGFIISVSAAYAVFLKWAKLWELESRVGKSSLP